MMSDARANTVIVDISLRRRRRHVDSTRPAAVSARGPRAAGAPHARGEHVSRDGVPRAQHECRYPDVQPVLQPALPHCAVYPPRRAKVSHTAPLHTRTRTAPRRMRTPRNLRDHEHFLPRSRTTRGRARARRRVARRRAGRAAARATSTSAACAAPAARTSRTTIALRHAPHAKCVPSRARERPAHRGP